MIAVEVDVRGLERLAAAVRRIEQELPREAQAAMRDAAKIVAREARRRAPRRSGRLVASIETEATVIGALNHAEGRVVVTARKASPKYPAGYPYPRRIEFAERPFVRPALASKVREVTEMLERRVVGDGIVRKWGAT